MSVSRRAQYKSYSFSWKLRETSRRNILCLLCRQWTNGQGNPERLSGEPGKSPHHPPDFRQRGTKGNFLSAEQHLNGIRKELLFTAESADGVLNQAGMIINNTPLPLCLSTSPSVAFHWVRFPFFLLFLPELISLLACFLKVGFYTELSHRISSFSFVAFFQIPAVAINSVCHLFSLLACLATFSGGR